MGAPEKCHDPGSEIWSWIASTETDASATLPWILVHDLPRCPLAVSLDQALLQARCGRCDGLRGARRILLRCGELDLPDEVARRLERAVECLRKEPEQAERSLAQLRADLRTPVSGLLLWGRVG